ncbi:hypothetical protein G6F50_018754 [Rhizopus delemar]|uniref:Uncharacterized protein n=1 Tax=Rhizopus delemar TaxID=936053 RepID=A0A9P7BXR8_9FUNG|nr:hypothetical protein G6F50_018754 [Rhizopus delemar]
MPRFSARRRALCQVRARSPGAFQGTRPTWSGDRTAGCPSSLAFTFTRTGYRQRLVAVQQRFACTAPIGCAESHAT